MIRHLSSVGSSSLLAGEVEDLRRCRVPFADQAERRVVVGFCILDHALDIIHLSGLRFSDPELGG